MNLASFDLNLLKVLDALLAEGSTTRAGERVGLSQPAVSAALGRLRGVLGDPLFVRQGQGLAPTDFARSLAEPLRDLLTRTEVLLEGPGRFDPGTARQTFRLSGSDFFTELLMPPLMARLGGVAPGLTLRFVDRVAPGRVEEMRDGGIDLLFLPREDFPAWADWRPAFWSGFDMIARERHPRLAAAGVRPGQAPPLDLYCDLGHVLFAMRDEEAGLEDEALAAAGGRRRIVLTVPSFGSVWRAVAGSDLVAVLPRRLAAKVAPEAGLSVHPLPFAMPRLLLCTIWHRRLTPSAAHRWLRDEVMEVLAPLNAGEPPVPAGMALEAGQPRDAAFRQRRRS